MMNFFHFGRRQLPIAPTDFRGQRATVAENVDVLTKGIEGTSMAPWTDRLTDPELRAVARYVQSFYMDGAQ